MLNVFHYDIKTSNFINISLLNVFHYDIKTYKIRQYFSVKCVPL